jgi:hypothetical protein
VNATPRFQFGWAQSGLYIREWVGPTPETPLPTHPHSFSFSLALSFSSPLSLLSLSRQQELDRASFPPEIQYQAVVIIKADHFYILTSNFFFEWQNKRRFRTKIIQCCTTGRPVVNSPSTTQKQQQRKRLEQLGSVIVVQFFLHSSPSGLICEKVFEWKERVREEEEVCVCVVVFFLNRSKVEEIVTKWVIFGGDFLFLSFWSEYLGTDVIRQSDWHKLIGHFFY